jgi:hypothetical protein
MKKIFFFLSLLFVSFLFVNSCANNENTEQVIAKKDPKSTCSKPTIMDPNTPKPMALMMRSMAANADSIKAKILRGEKLDSLQFPFIRFYLEEPTDKNVLEPTFFEHARVFQTAFHEVFKHPTEQKKYYNLYIEKCVACHQNYCSGPLKRINKMPIND